MTQFKTLVTALSLFMVSVASNVMAADDKATVKIFMTTLKTVIQ